MIHYNRANIVNVGSSDYVLTGKSRVGTLVTALNVNNVSDPTLVLCYIARVSEYDYANLKISEGWADDNAATAAIKAYTTSLNTSKVPIHVINCNSLAFVDAGDKDMRIYVFPVSAQGARITTEVLL